MIDIKKRYPTRNGLPVRLYAMDGAQPYPIHGAILVGRGWRPASWTTAGRYHNDGFTCESDLIEISQQMTGWFPPEIAPVHVGVYNASRRYREDVCRDWDGKTWSLGWRNVDSPLTIAECKNHRIPDVFPWRGFTEPQE
jgi:hypothetical protein